MCHTFSSTSVFGMFLLAFLFGLMFLLALVLLEAASHLFLDREEDSLFHD